MADKMQKNYKISGSGILTIDNDKITICVDDRGEFNLASVLTDLNEKPVKFSFSYDDDYEATIDVDAETGEVI